VANRGSGSNSGGSNERGLAKYFEFGKFKTSYRKEFIAGLTTFLAMAYILIVNPLILGDAGMDKGAVFTATAIAAIIGSLVMGLYAKYPIALAPGMGLNAFFAYTVVIGSGVPWEQALAAVFVSGIVFLILALSGIRETIINAIPASLKYSAAAGIGLFIAFIGMKNAGIVVSDAATFVRLGDFNLDNKGTLLALFGIVVTIILMVRKIYGAVFYGIVITSIVGIIFSVVALPDAVVDLPPNPTGLFVLFDHLFTADMWTSNMIVVIFTFFFVEFFDTAGTLFGLASQAGLIDKDGKLPRAGRALAADSVATIAGAIVGTSTTTAYIESSAGVAAGGRTGFTAVSAAFFFVLALFFFPLLSVVDAFVTAPALIIVGVLMASALKKIDWESFEEALPAFIVVVAMPLTYSIANGIALGFILYPIIKIAKGEARKVHPIMYVLFVVFICYFVFLR
jgi:AGZA family xanthine/uracil permease-like MFS transporter